MKAWTPGQTMGCSSISHGVPILSTCWGDHPLLKIPQLLFSFCPEVFQNFEERWWGQRVSNVPWGPFPLGSRSSGLLGDYLPICSTHSCLKSHIESSGPWWLKGKESACQCRRCRFTPWVRKIPWGRKWQSTPVFLPGKSHGQRSLAGYMGSQKSQTRLSD